MIYPPVEMYKAVDRKVTPSWMSPSLFVAQMSVEGVVVHKAMFLHRHRTVGQNEKNFNVVIMF